MSKRFVFCITLLLAATRLMAASPPYPVYGYLGDWDGVTVAQMPWNSLTHVMDAFGFPNDNGTITKTPNTTMITGAHANGKKILLALGGATDGVSNASLRSRWNNATQAGTIDTFVANIMNFIATNNYDGIDIDWEFPTTAQRPQFMSLMQKLWSACTNSADPNWKGSRKELTFFISPGYDICGVDWATIANYCDYGILGGYDFQATRAGMTFNGPIDSASLFTDCLGVQHSLSVKGTVDRLVGLGFTTGKMILALPLYQVPSYNNVEAVICSGAGGTQFSPELERQWNGGAEAVTDAWSLCQKMNWAAGYGLAGFGLWEVAYAVPTNACPAIVDIWSTLAGTSGCLNFLGTPTITPTFTRTFTPSPSPTPTATLVPCAAATDTIEAIDTGGYISGGATPWTTTIGLQTLGDAVLVNGPGAATGWWRMSATAYSGGTISSVTLYVTWSSGKSAGNGVLQANTCYASADCTSPAQADIVFTSTAAASAYQTQFSVLTAPGPGWSWTDINNLSLYLFNNTTAAPAGTRVINIDEAHLVVSFTAPCGSPTNSPSPTRTPTRTITLSVSPSPSVSPSGSPTRSASPSPSVSPSPTRTSSPTLSPTPSHSPSPTRSQSPTFSASPSPSPSATPTGSRTASPTPTLSPSFSVSPTGSPSNTPSHSPSPTRTVSGTQSTTPTVTETRTPSLSPTRSVTLTVTPTATPSATPSMSPTQSGTQTITPTVTETRTPSLSPTRSVTLTVTPTATPSATPSVSPTQSPTQSVTPTVTETRTLSFSPTQSVTRTVTPTATQSVTPSVSPTQSVTSTVTPTATETRTLSFSPTQSATRTISPTGTATPSPTATPTQTPTVTQSVTPSVSPTQSGTQTITPTVTQSETQSFSPTRSATRTVTPTSTPSATPSDSPTGTETYTSSPTRTVTVTASATPTQSETFTATPSVTESMTLTDSPTQTVTRTVTVTATPSVSSTSTPSASPTRTASPTPSFSPSQSATLSASPSRTVSPTRTFSPTPTGTRSQTATVTRTATPSATLSVSPSRTASQTITPSATRTASTTATPSITPSVTLSNTPGPLATATVSPTPTPTVSATPRRVQGKVPHIVDVLPVPNPQSGDYLTLAVQLEGGTTDRISLSLYTVAMTQVLLTDVQPGGPYNLGWVGVNVPWPAELSTGLYYVRLEAVNAIGVAKSRTVKLYYLGR